MNKEQIKYWYLQNHSLFERMNETEINSLCIISSFKEGNKNDIIFFSDSEIKRLYTIKEGAIKVCTTDKNDKEIILEILSEGDIFGCLSSKDINGNLYNNQYAVILKDHTKICSFETEAFQNVLNTNNHLANNFRAKMEAKLDQMQMRFTNIAFKDIDERVFSFFEQYSKVFHPNFSYEGSYELKMYFTHQEIADYIASSRQSVTTSIGKLIDKKVLTYHSRTDVLFQPSNN